MYCCGGHTVHSGGSQLEVQHKCLSDWYFESQQESQVLRLCRSRLQRTGVNLGLEFRDMQENNNFSGYKVKFLQ